MTTTITTAGGPKMMNRMQSSCSVSSETSTSQPQRPTGPITSEPSIASYNGYSQDESIFEEVSYTRNGEKF